ncbi:sn-glycerol-3-phosphate ABC transporter substrate-binding protein UgpB [Halomonas desiderata]|jgi:sn-glycerol 3-phosphate transport system substrate-binding protein|uniref:sn-glycerol-3-phosphate-binding periplasmic protein UgpB n=1 Tax=Billgrantia desiderata TaxID=52021 RepID=A0ABS9B9B5_9GAMM|nr:MULTISPECIES: sn-glycerol-3-phosphate ABC transporter substrate-binding protein UgpB [Halomonas]MCE8010060.1 sn-glycerol-3-phosphate ABC transporter substrate-binding protein UgpB [Halomonas desiderata]MCE8040252.1 sn-glycerol-3-phosphate ABC transporter substrate-binding protein UgpB [Halomonas sp. MCCC 1A11062]MCE8043789.1 sn-glycerol-3-phosphate ABC transporter substrate-binding protein UgpB [Halomonas desiderata]MCE8048488.1 sn-glycerol-3-phosphate ABC transporter substrate-binding prote
MSPRSTAFMSGALVASLSFSVHAATEVQWWHAMGGELGEMLEAVTEEFNASQDDYRVRPSYRGNYTETMTGAIAAFRAGQHPHILQVFEVGTGTMMAAEGAVYPIYQLMEDHGRTFDREAFLPAVVGYYTDTRGNMLSFPFNSSTPILYYNRDAFEAAGLEGAPQTWEEIEAYSRQLREQDAANCGFTTSWPSWVMLENFSAMHDSPLGTLENGFGGLETEFVFDNDLVARHWDNLKAWQDEGVFRWGGPGPGNDAAPMFYSGECAMFFGSSAARAGVLANADFSIGYGMLPYYEDVDGAPQNSIIGGATLWTLQGHSEEEYAAVAAFFDYLSQPEVQADWHQKTGYLPITHAAWELSESQGFYTENPGTEISIEQMTLNEPTENSKGLRFGNFVQIRDIISEEMEAVMTSSKSGEQASADAARRGNALLRDFEQANQ